MEEVKGGERELRREKQADETNRGREGFTEE